MIDIIQNKIERAILIAVKTQRHQRELVHEHMNELEELARTAGAETVHKIIQEKQYYDVAFYIGKGKADEIALLVEDDSIDLLVFDDDLTPVQARNLQNLMKRKIVDRSGLILDIFASHAKTKQARTQVELAQLQYMLPRLTRAWTHLSKQFGGIGTKGPGETQIETDRRIIRDRIAFLKSKLTEIESDRSIQTRLRKEQIKATLVGYTNAGKSTLFNLLTGAEVLAEDKLFATLDSTTRSFQIQKNRNILLSDTVGFIRKLPHHLVASFKSTLSEVMEADIILQVIDMSHAYFEDHIAVVDQTLEELGCKDKRQIKVFNKADAVEDQNLVQYITNKYPGSVVISAGKGINITRLKELMLALMEDGFCSLAYKLPHEKSYLIAKAHQFAEEISEQYNDDEVILTLKIKKTEMPKINFLEPFLVSSEPKTAK